MALQWKVLSQLLQAGHYSVQGCLGISVRALAFAEHLLLTKAHQKRNCLVYSQPPENASQERAQERIEVL